MKVKGKVPFRVCLFGGEIEWMKNFGKKMGRQTFWWVFGWRVGRGGKKIDGAHVFSPLGHQNVFSPKWR